MVLPSCTLLVLCLVISPLFVFLPLLSRLVDAKQRAEENHGKGCDTDKDDSCHLSPSSSDESMQNVAEDLEDVR